MDDRWLSVGEASRALGMSRTTVTAAIETTVDEPGQLDVLVNNAAIVTSAPFWELSEPEWRAVLDINLSGVWRTTKAAVVHLRRSPWEWRRPGSMTPRLDDTSPARIRRSGWGSSTARSC